ncbi:MAG: TonB family protein [Hellea sp.]
MYQSIDDPQEELDALERGDKRVVIFLLTGLCLALVFGIIYWTSTGSKIEAPDDGVIRAEQVTYRNAISETTAPMRRARLQDFITTYPESGYIRSVEAQLDVINHHESKAWIAVTDVAFSLKTRREDKLAALDGFEAQWGGSLLGGRGAEIEELRAEIMETAETPKAPSRKMTDLKSPIPKTVPDTLLAGGPRIAPPPILRPIAPQPKPEEVVQLKIVQPVAIKDRLPKYPSRAWRRKIGAVVKLKLNIDEDGRVAMTELVSVEAERYEKNFIRAAERAAMRTRFHPKTADGQPQAAIGVPKTYVFDPTR